MSNIDYCYHFSHITHYARNIFGCVVNIGELKVFFDKREAIEALYKDPEYLSERTLKGTINYINDFYEIIENKNNIKSSILDNCR